MFVDRSTVVILADPELVTAGLGHAGLEPNIERSEKPPTSFTRDSGPAGCAFSLGLFGCLPVARRTSRADFRES